MITRPIQVRLVTAAVVLVAGCCSQPPRGRCPAPTPRAHAATARHLELDRMRQELAAFRQAYERLLAITREILRLQLKDVDASSRRSANMALQSLERAHRELQRQLIRLRSLDH